MYTRFTGNTYVGIRGKFPGIYHEFLRNCGSKIDLRVKGPIYSGTGGDSGEIYTTYMGGGGGRENAFFIEEIMTNSEE
jgi:hypothetical protein